MKTMLTSISAVRVSNVRRVKAAIRKVEKQNPEHGKVKMAVVVNKRIPWRASFNNGMMVELTTGQVFDPKVCKQYIW